MTTPTPTPWNYTGYEVRQPDGRYIAYTGPHHTVDDFYPPACKAEDEANAEFIARACNSHQRLTHMVEAFKVAASLEGLGSNAAWKDMIDEAGELLALATGKESA
jgi:hypothetical protein